MRHRTPRARGQPLRAVCPRKVVRLFRPLGRNWTTRINSGRPTVRLPQTEAWAERERVPSGHNCRRQLATGRPDRRARQCPERRYLRITRSGAGRLWSRRAAGFLWYFLSLRKKVLPLRGGSPTIRAVVGASCSNRGKGYAPTGARAFRSPFGNLRAPKLEKNP